MSAKASPVVLESGDRLTRAEFHDRYCRQPDTVRAELVKGVVYVASPTRYAFHDLQHGAVTLWLGTYAIRHADVRFSLDATIFLGPDTEVKPDGSLFYLRPPDSTAAGAARIREDGYIEGAPQLVVEVAASSAAYDLHDKLDAYREAGVREYVVWRVLDEAIDWFRLRGAAYERVSPDERGVIESEAFPGLRLHVQKMLDNDIRAVLAELDRPGGG